MTQATPFGVTNAYRPPRLRPSAMFLEPSLLRVYHWLRIIDDAGDQPLTGYGVDLAERSWPHWVLVHKGADILLAGDPELMADRPDVTNLEIAISDPAQAVIYSNGAWRPGDAPLRFGLEVLKTDVGPGEEDPGRTPGLVRPHRLPKPDGGDPGLLSRMKNVLIILLKDHLGADIVAADLSAHPRSTPIPIDDGEGGNGAAPVAVVAAPEPVPLTKVSDGKFKTAERVWTAAFRPARVFRDFDDDANKLFLANVLIDPAKAETVVELTMPAPLVSNGD